MGIDVYLHWDKQTEEEQGEQVTGFSIRHCHAGYLREAYHGGPYATHILAREAFESESGEAEIPAAVMRERLTHVTEPARGVSGGSVAAEMIFNTLNEITSDTVECPGAQPFGTHTTEPESVEECVRVRCANIYPDMTEEDVEAYVQSFRDFVTLAEQKEAQTGKPCTVCASY